MNFSVIIIGAGAAGLQAARELSGAGFSVLILEAAKIPGGRIQTVAKEGFSEPLETGAEFVHGALPLTLELLREAGITYRPVKGRMIRVHQGEWGKQNMFEGQWDELMEKMENLQKDLPIANFLAQEFSGQEYAGLRNSVQRFAEGYDLADIRTASTRALFREWQEEGQEEYRIDGGYSRLIHFLENQCLSAGCRIEYGLPAKEIRWQQGRVEVTAADGQNFAGDKLIVTVSLGVLQMDPPALQFFPPIPGHLQAARQLGYGAVIKILMEFREAFWKEKAKGVSFILSDEAIPTWWLQYPETSPLLTGWLTGAAMRDFQILDTQSRTELCLRSLAAIFDRDLQRLREELVAVQMADWPAAPFIRGGYSFDTVFSEEARKTLCRPIQETIFFAGEALYEGNSTATVEAALTSGQQAAQKIIAQS